MRCAESDVVRIFDDKLSLSQGEMEYYLRQANLERNGFTKTTETCTETDENGKTTKKTTIYYKVTDDCSQVMFWESVLEQRLPEELKVSKLSSTTVKEVNSRIAGRRTKSCTVGLEIHQNRCLRKSSNNGVSKRGARKCSWCLLCFNASIQYWYISRIPSTWMNIGHKLHIT